MMEKHAYLLVTDLHDLGHLKGNRLGYSEEIIEIKRFLLNTVEKYKRGGYVPVVIFLGDIFDRGYKDAMFRAINSNNYFVVLRQLCEIYAVMGNHEFSFYNDNPFYSLVTEIESTKVVKRQNRVWTPQGTLPLLRVVDKIEDGDLVIHFNHDGTPISPATPGKHNVGLFHQDVICNQILEQASREIGASIFSRNHLPSFDFTDFFDGFDACFFGHLHKVYGTWQFQKNPNDKPCDLVYLASLGRPAQDEVNNANLERSIPALLVHDGHYCGYEHNTLMLWERERSVDEVVVAAEQATYKKVKERKQLLERQYSGTDPITDVKQSCTTPAQLKIFEEFLLYGKSELCESSLRKVQQINGGKQWS